MVSELFLYSKRIFIMQQGFSPDIKLRPYISHLNMVNFVLYP